MTALATELFREVLDRQRAVLATAVTAGLGQVDLDLAPSRLRAAVDSWATSAAVTTESVQATAAAVALTYSRQLTAAAGVVEAMPSVDLTARVGVVPQDVPGTSLDDAYRRAGFSVLWRLRGAPRDTAVRYGRYAAMRVSHTSVQEAATSVLDDVMREHPRIVGWRRIASANACDRCVLAASRQYKATEPLRRRHPTCACSQEPIVVG